MLRYSFFLIILLFVHQHCFGATPKRGQYFKASKEKKVEQIIATLRTVEEGKLYRSASGLDEKQLQQLGIKTIVNLFQVPRRSRESQIVVDNITKIFKAKEEYQQIYIPLSQGLPEKEHVAQLHAIFSDETKHPRPLLVCCRDGVSNTGFAAALWFLRKGKPCDEALEQFMVLNGKQPDPAKIFLIEYIASNGLDYDQPSCQRAYDRYKSAKKCCEYFCCCCDRCFNPSCCCTSNALASLLTKGLSLWDGCCEPCDEILS